MSNIDRRFSVAPMMDWTDSRCRRFHRALSREALLYTEMVTADAIVHGDRGRLLDFAAVEHPLVLQLGGSEPEKLARATQIARDWGYDAFNLNVGCPSERVQSGAFGACLMREPELVADCLAAMRESAGGRPVTVKHRLGVDDDDPRDRLFSFVELLAARGTTQFTVHARKAWLKGLSPKENREIPPLDQALVFELKKARPDLRIELNGGVTDMAGVRAALAQGVDAVMVGRAAYQTPAMLLEVDAEPGDGGARRTPLQAALDFRDEIVAMLEEGMGLHAMTRHMLGLFHGAPGAREWRRVLSTDAPGARGRDAIAVYDLALSAVARRVGERVRAAEAAGLSDAG